MAISEVFYFGDQSVEPFDSIHQLFVESRTSKALAEFLQFSFTRLTEDVSRLSHVERELFRADTFETLARSIQTNRNTHVAMTTVLSCVAQLGWTILHRERDPRKWLPGVHRTIVGICTGSLAAIAAASALSDADLMRLAPEFVILASRVGIEVSRRSINIENSSSSWSLAVSQISQGDLEAAVRAFNETRQVPPHTAIYISALSDSAITLSGPPSSLVSFISSSKVSDTALSLSLPIYGAFHAPHLPVPSIRTIVGPGEIWERTISSTVQDSLVASFTTRDHGRTLGEIVSEAILNIFQQPLDFVSTVQDVSRKLQSTERRVTSFGPAHTNMLKRALSPVEIERFGSPNTLTSKQTSTDEDYRDAIAIIGMACRVPGAQNVDELWQLLLDEKDMHQQIPPDRFDVATHYDPTGKVPNTTITQWGCFDDHVGDFDLALYKMSPREALQTDPCHRMMLVTGYEALQDAGYYDPGDLPRPKFGTFYGQAGDDYRQVNSGQNIDTNYITGGIRAFAPGRVSYYFGWEGPSMNIDTACSSSAVAINQACSSLKLGECDLALAGGVNLLTSSDFFAGLSRARFISTTGPCKTLDETADGYCRADGAGSIVVKRYQDALRDKDNILGVIRSIETAHAGTAISITHPEADTQIALFQNILSKIGMDARHIDHVEMHGTGTQAGDLAETTSIAGLLDITKIQRPADRPLTIASIKPNVGHSEGASGVTSLIKALLMFKHRINPKHIGIKTRFNPKLLPLADMGIEVPLQHRPYSPTTDKRRILVNNFNATGGVTAMIVEEHGPRTVQTSDPRGHYPIVFSAANQKSLVKGLENLVEYLESSQAISIPDLSYTLTARRLHHSWAFSCAASNVDELIKSLQKEISTPRTPISRKRSALKTTVFVFTGQAVSHAGMARVLFNTNKLFREHLQCSDAMCQTMGFPSFLDVIENKDTKALSDFNTTQAHLALVAIEIALAYLLDSWDIRPQYVLGHSLGEYSALCVSQAISVADALYLVGKRAQLIEARCRPNEYSMIATSLSGDEAQRYLSQFPQCETACLNGPSQTVISGSSNAIHALSQDLARRNVKVKTLSVDYAFHSAQMDVILPDYEKIANGISFKEPSIPMVSTCLGEVMHLEHLTAKYLCRQTRSPVKFHESVNKLSSIHPESPPLWIELGPAPACTPFISLILGTNDTVTVLDPNKPNWRTISSMVTKYYTSIGNLRWDYFHKEYLDNLKLISTPSYPFDMTRHWFQYVGNWSITKNRAPVQYSGAASVVHQINSSTLHRLESDLEDQGTRKLVFLSDLDLHPATEAGLFVDIGSSLCATPSLYVDMAMTAALDLWKRSDRGDAMPSMELTSIDIDGDQRILKGPSRIKMRLIVTQEQTFRSTANIHIMLSSEQEERELAKCMVVFSDLKAWASEAEETAFLYRSRMDLLEMFHKATFSFPTSAIQHRLGQPTGIQEIILNPGTREAVAKLKYQSAKGEFILNPGWVNTLLQIPRFILAHEGMRCSIKSMQKLRMLAPLKPEATFRIHARLSLLAGSTAISGSLHVFDDQGLPVAELKEVTLKVIREDSVAKHKPQLTFPQPFQLPETGIANGDVTLLNSAASSQESPDGSPLIEPISIETSVTPPVLEVDFKGPTVLGKPTSNDFPIWSDTAPSTPASRVAVQTETSVRHHTHNIPTKSTSRPTLQDSQTQPHTSSLSVVNIDGILSILAEELGVDLVTINEEEPLEDMGVDSIMQMTLIAKMQEGVESERKLPGQLLVEHNSFKKLKAFFREW